MWLPGGMLVDVFVDRACPVVSEAWVPALQAVPVDLSTAAGSKQLFDAGILLLGTRTLDGSSALNVIRAIRQKNAHLIIAVCVELREANRVPFDQWFKHGTDEFATIGQTLDSIELLRLVESRGQAPPPASWQLRQPGRGRSRAEPGPRRPRPGRRQRPGRAGGGR